MNVSIVLSGMVALLLAKIGIIGLLILGLTSADGYVAVAGIVGFDTSGTPTELSLRYVLGLDMLLSIGYAAAHCLLAFGLARSAAQFAVAGTVVLFVFAGLSFDFLENAAFLAGEAAASHSIAKFGFLAVAGFLLVSLLPLDTVLQGFARMLGQGIFPLMMVGMLAGFPFFERPIGSLFALLIGYTITGLAIWSTVRNR